MCIMQNFEIRHMSVVPSHFASHSQVQTFSQGGNEVLIKLWITGPSCMESTSDTGP